jgi:hypothetical protein
MPAGAVPPPEATEGQFAPGPPANVSFPGGAEEQAGNVDPAQWRTSYDAFRANVQVDSTLGIPQVKFRAINELQAALDEVRQEEADGDVGEEELAERARKFAAVGEVTWEATLTDADVSAGDWTARLNLPPLPEPLELNLALDEKNPGNWQSLKAGERVRFVGRFVDYDPAVGDLVMEIRFPGQRGAR